MFPMLGRMVVELPTTNCGSSPLSMLSVRLVTTEIPEPPSVIDPVKESNGVFVFAAP